MNVSDVSQEIVFQTRFGWLHFWVTLCLLGTLILCTIVGNVFVVAAILLEKHLQGVSNYLILSLAVADLMVATLPMPISAINEVSEDWWLGDALCDFWVCSDVLCCTASILHLVGIALDRYWAVTNAEYIRRRTAKRIGIMITLFWLLSIAISLPARFHLTRLGHWMERVQTVNQSFSERHTADCGINKEYGYTIFSTVGAFYMPMFFMMCIYARIYQVAKARIRRSTFRKRVNSVTEPELPVETSKHQREGQKPNCRTTKAQHVSNRTSCFRRSKHMPSKHSKLNDKQPASNSTSTRRTIVPLTSSEFQCTATNGKSNIHCRRASSSFGCFSQIWARITKPLSHADHTYTTEADGQWKATDTVLTHAPHLTLSSVQPKDTQMLNDATNPEDFMVSHPNQCQPCLDPIFASSDEDEHIIRQMCNRISRSAPASLFEGHRRSFSSASSSLDSSCSTVNRSEKFDATAWSSSCSVEHRAESRNDKGPSAQRLCAVMKTLIISRMHASPASNRTEPGPSKSETNKKIKWTVPKLRSVRPSRSNKNPLKIGPIKRKLSHSCSGTPHNMNNVMNDCDIPTIDSDIEEVTVDHVYHARFQNPVEMDDASGGTLHLEARLKSTVCEVTKLATVTAMVKRERLENQRERKAVVTLAIITGCFMLCWLPFFIVALIAPFYEDMRLSKVGQGIILWLGYSNSLLNPIIYTIFSPDFRNAFRKILFGRYYFRYRDR